jgi:hypothetical protein
VSLKTWCFTQVTFSLTFSDSVLILPRKQFLRGYFMLDFHDKLICAELVWDGGDEVIIPSHMSSPAPNQMQGTAHQRLGEISARICYDSLGIDPDTGKPRGRSSEEMHQHLIEVKNHSVYEHCTFTVVLQGRDFEGVISCLLNRPGVWVEWIDDRLEVTLNHRSVLEWEKWTSSPGQRYSWMSFRLGNSLWHHARELAPRLYKSETRYLPSLIEMELKTRDLNSRQAWVSLYLRNSRACSHEQVRHGNDTAISQRSTRFCSEEESPYITHPLIQQYLNTVDPGQVAEVRAAMESSIQADRKAYRTLTDHLTHFFKGRGVRGTNARKQAWGSARGYLGNALMTEMIFSASCAQWRWMLSQRGSVLADAEIRELYAPGVLTALKQSRYRSMFDDLSLEPSPDGIGQVVTGF